MVVNDSTIEAAKARVTEELRRIEHKWQK
jgi:hypothetical protein